MINIEELHREQDKKEESRQEIYNRILEMAHQKIKLTSKISKDKFCFFSVPIFVAGLPLFNVNNCIIFLTKTLTDNGFNIRYTHPNLLLISWYEKPKKNHSNLSALPLPQRIEEARRKALEYKPITDYKPSNNFVYDSNSLNTLRDKANKLLFDTKF
jgi:hypothetical protein